MGIHFLVEETSIPSAVVELADVLLFCGRGGACEDEGASANANANTNANVSLVATFQPRSMWGSGRVVLFCDCRQNQHNRPVTTPTPQAVEFYLGEVVDLKGSPPCVTPPR